MNQIRSFILDRIFLALDIGSFVRFNYSEFAIIDVLEANVLRGPLTSDVK